MTRWEWGAKEAAGEYFPDDVDECPGCTNYVPCESMEALIGTPMLCFPCRMRIQQRRYDEIMLGGLMGLS